jgi:hypothetical protein
MDRCGRTAAFVGKDIRYNTDQLRCFGTPQETEDRFAIDYRFGKIIPDDYVKSFSDFLIRIRNNIYFYDRDMYAKHTFKCHIAMVKMDFKRSYHERRDTVILNEIEVRPCAANNGMSKLILWQIIKSCEALKLDFVVEGPLEQTRDILGGINSRLVDSFFQPPERLRTTPMGFIYDHYLLESLLPLETFSSLDESHFKIAHFLIKKQGDFKHDLTLNRDAFPTADVMNNGPSSN